MGKAIMVGAGLALFLGFIFACVVIGFALLSGSQADVGYAPFGDVGTSAGDAGSGDYDTVDTAMQIEIPLIVNKMGTLSPISFRG